MNGFQKLQSLNTNTFELKEKDKLYDRYLQRIQHIVNRKYKQDLSPSLIMKSLRGQRKVAYDANLDQNQSKIKYENCHLYNRIMELKSRPTAVTGHQLIDMSGTRRREIERINKENQEMGQRLARRYNKKTKGWEGEQAMRKANKSIYLKDRKLPLLVDLRQSLCTLENSPAK